VVPVDLTRAYKNHVFIGRVSRALYSDKKRESLCIIVNYILFYFTTITISIGVNYEYWLLTKFLSLAKTAIATATATQRKRKWNEVDSNNAFSKYFYFVQFLYENQKRETNKNMI